MFGSLSLLNAGGKEGRAIEDGIKNELGASIASKSIYRLFCENKKLEKIKK